MSAPPAAPSVVPDLDSLSLADQSRVSDVVDDFARRLTVDPDARVTETLLDGFAGPTREVLLHHLLLEEYDRRTETAARQVADDILGRQAGGPDRTAAETALARRTDPAPRTAEGDRPRFRRYTPEGELGRGGTAVVYAAFDARLRVRVAVKVLHPHLCDDPAVVRAFRQEGRRQVELRGSAVPTVYDTGHTECGRPFVAMEVVSGGGIRGRLPGPAGPFRFDPDLVRLVGRVCRAIAPIHARGFAHLDLSPSNVHLTPDGQVKVLDFGLAGEPGAAPAGLDGGTPNFLAPEKARRQPHLYSPRTDVFSLGCFLVWAVTGRPLYPDAEPAELVRRVAAAELAEPLACLKQAVRRHRVPKELADLTARCLAEQPDRRPADAGAVADAIDSYFRTAEEERQQARVATARRRGLLAVLGVLAVATAGGWGLFALLNQEQVRRVTAEAEVRIRNGDAAAEAGRWADARTEWRPLTAERAGLTDARRFEVRLRLVRAASFLGDHAEVREELTALDAHPLAPQFRGRLDFERAIHHLDAANRHALSKPGNLTAENPFDAAAYLLLCRVRDDPAAPPADKATARGLLAGTAADAIVHYREALAVEPFHPYAGPYLLVTCLLAGRLTDALARADAWAEATPQDPLPWFYKAFTLTLQGRTADADAALARLARAAGGGRAMPLSTLRACEGTVRAARVINARLPDSATAPDHLTGLLIGLATVKELADVLPDGQDAALAALFAVPVPATPRRAFGRVLAAYESLAANPAGGLALTDKAEECVADGAVLFLRGLLLRRLGRPDEAAEALLACAESDRQLWEVRAVCRLTLAAHALNRADQATDPDTAAGLRSQAKAHLRRAAEGARESPAVSAKLRQLAGRLNDAEFTTEVDRLLPPVGRR